MHRLNMIMDKLEETLLSEMEKGVECVNTEEAGEVVDMIKDICEAMYYYSVYEAMKDEKRMVVAEHREASPEHWAKESHKPKHHTMESLEMYMKDLSEEVTDMITSLDNNQKAMLKNKMQVLMQKIQ